MSLAATGNALAEEKVKVPSVKAEDVYINEAFENAFGIEYEKFAFNAVTEGSGAVKGHFVIQDVFFPGAPGLLKAKGRIVCYKFLPDGRITWAGYVEEAFDPFGLPTNFFVGTGATWVGTDGKETGLPDTSTDLLFGFEPFLVPLICDGAAFYNQDLLPIQSGNIAVEDKK